MNTETCLALATILAAIIGAVAVITAPIIHELIKRWLESRDSLPLRKKPKVIIFVISLIILVVFISFLALNLSRDSIQFNWQRSKTPTPISRGELVMEINFLDGREGKCNDYDPNLLGYENQQYYIKPPAYGHIAICHENDQLEPEGSLQVSAFPESSLQGDYGFAVLFGWKGDSLKTTDACIFGIRRQGNITRAFFENRVDGKITSDTQELNAFQLDNAPHTLRVVLHRDGNAIGYLDERFVAEYNFPKCKIGPVGMIAWGPGDKKVYFDDLKFFGLP